MGMTDPGAGTDVLGMQTTATRRGDEYVLNGRKPFITNGPDAYCLLVYAKVAGKITAFLVDRTCPGFASGAHIEKMGMRAAPMGELIFDDCVVPAANRLGAEGGGMVHMMRNLEIERLCLADRCMDIMLRYSVRTLRARWRSGARLAMPDNAAKPRFVPPARRYWSKRWGPPQFSRRWLSAAEDGRPGLKDDVVRGR